MLLLLLLKRRKRRNRRRTIGNNTLLRKGLCEATCALLLAEVGEVGPAEEVLGERGGQGERGGRAVGGAELEERDLAAPLAQEAALRVHGEEPRGERDRARGPLDVPHGDEEQRVARDVAVEHRERDALAPEALRAEAAVRRARCERGGRAQPRGGLLGAAARGVGARERRERVRHERELHVELGERGRGCGRGFMDVSGVGGRAAARVAQEGLVKVGLHRVAAAARLHALEAAHLHRKRDIHVV